ncbi:hypothetical protein C4D60_Mb05t15190 [Musa balbisiana]|uniref:Uncharacterized protein n=1 Tax=Musa balbisiana TaxID=52838 RepID=A0A4S8JWB7_MUSBA|nr:hypothetical protein C4D60_Mb05t15190 [Musa balbisiana]
METPENMILRTYIREHDVGRSWKDLSKNAGMANPSRETHHEDEQAGKNAKRIKVGMVEFELWLNVGNYT